MLNEMPKLARLAGNLYNLHLAATRIDQEYVHLAIQRHDLQHGNTSIQRLSTDRCKIPLFQI